MYLMIALSFVVGSMMGFLIGFLWKSIKSNDDINKEIKKELDNSIAKILVNTGDFVARNYLTQLDSAIQPFKENISQFKQRVEAIHNAETQQVGQLNGQLNRMFNLHNQLSVDTNNLTSALKGNVKLQGLWGENILKNLLESSGLKKDIHYYEQPNYRSLNNQRMQPDFIIKLPEDRDIIVDSKMSVNSYVNYFNSISDDKSDLLSEIKNSFKRHISSLDSKQYHTHPDSKSPMVLLFIPIEALFILLIENFAELFIEASKRKIYITSPSLLMPLLTIIDHTWKQNAQNKNVMEMARIAGKIYDKLVGIVNEVDSVKGSLAKTHSSLDSLVIKLKGKDGIISNVSKLSELGADHNKELPGNWIEHSNQINDNNSIQ